MVKEPRPGRVKTRLGRDIGMTAAAWWFRHQVAGLLRHVADPRWDVVLAVSPDREGMLSRVWPPQYPRIPQGPGDLGTRMTRALSLHGPVCVIGADIPGIKRHHIARAFAQLGSYELVFGPAPDGGYWLVGVKHDPPCTLFAKVRWSTEHALADTLASVPGRRVSLVDTLRDVDTADDLAMTAL
jgi:rSAM/selenodomain-associated transferase 1